MTMLGKVAWNRGKNMPHSKEKRGLRFTKEYKSWRDSVISRCGRKCKNCGKDDNLEVHPIVSIAETEDFIYEPANGVVLCIDCHRKLPISRRELGYIRGLAYIVTIPHNWQEYETCGNWKISKNGCILILISSLDNWKYETLIAVHELIEVILCKSRGITQKEVDKFDIEYEKKRKKNDFSEPGDSLEAPYHFEHRYATDIEKYLAIELDVNWNKYENAIDKLSM